MQPLLVYLLKLTCCLSCGYLFYYAMLRRMTYYQWNRAFLLLFSVFACIVPFLTFSFISDATSFNRVFFFTGQQYAPVNNASPVPVPAKGWSLDAVLLAVMVTGVLFFVARFLLRFYSLQKTRKLAKLLTADVEVKLYHLPGEAAPFSFYNSIYLDTTLYQEEELEKILAHELVHVNQKHTVDLLLAELICVVQWYNPFAWLLKQAIRQNLEFIADDAVLQKGISRKSYQYLLLKVSGAVPYTLANNLLFPSLKKRIQMMNKTKTGKTHLLKFICLAPLVCFLLVGFSGTSNTKPINNNPAAAPSETFRLSSLSFYINDDNAAAIIKNAQAKSFLKPGGLLSLSLISEEKKRLKTLLEKNGYDHLTAHAISFVMDTSATSQSFSVQVTVNLPQIRNTASLKETNRDALVNKTEAMAEREPVKKTISNPNINKQLADQTVHRFSVLPSHTTAKQ